MWAIQRARENRERAIEDVLTIYRGQGAPGDTTGNSPGTKWVALNAITEHLDYGRRSRAGPTRFNGPSRTPH